MSIVPEVFKRGHACHLEKESVKKKKKIKHLNKKTYKILDLN